MKARHQKTQANTHAGGGGEGASMPGWSLALWMHNAHTWLSLLDTRQRQRQRQCPGHWSVMFAARSPEEQKLWGNNWGGSYARPRESQGPKLTYAP